MRILNMSGQHGRVGWVDCVIPLATHEGLTNPVFRTANGDTWPAVLHRVLGFHGAHYRVRATMSPGLVISGEIVNGDGSVSAPAEFRPSPWVVDDIEALAPIVEIVEVVRDGDDERELVHKLSPFDGTLKAVRTGKSPTAQDWHLKGRCGDGWQFDGYWRVPADDDQVEVGFTIGFTSIRNDKIGARLRRVTIKTGELLWIDVPTVHGIEQPRLTGDSWEVDIVDVEGSLWVGRGQQLPAFWGALLCAPTELGILDMFSSNNLDTLRRLEAHQARLEAPLIAVGGKDEWHGRYLAFGAVPEVNSHHDSPTRIGELAKEEFDWLAQPRGLFDERRHGPAKQAGTTGEQQDHGATKCLEILTFEDPRQLYARKTTALGEPMRPVHFREDHDGEPWSFLAEDQLERVRFWSQIPHYSCSISPNQLGLPCPPPVIPSHGWTGKDDQHLSSNNLHALCALTGSPLIEQLVFDEIEAEVANTRNFEQPGGAPRALGRRMQTAINALFLTGDRRMLDVILRTASWFRLHYEGVAWFGDNERTLRPIAIGAQRGNPHWRDVPAIVCWEHGICGIGLAAAVTGITRLVEEDRIVLSASEEVRFHELIELTAEVCQFLALHAFFEENGGWSWAIYLRWLDDGMPIAPDAYRNREPGVVLVDEGRGRWGDWMMAPLRWLTKSAWRGEVVELVSNEALLRADRIVAWFERRHPGGVPADPQTREWWSVV